LDPNPTVEHNRDHSKGEKCWTPPADSTTERVSTNELEKWDDAESPQSARKRRERARLEKPPPEKPHIIVLSLTHNQLRLPHVLEFALILNQSLRRGIFQG